MIERRVINGIVYIRDDDPRFPQTFFQPEKDGDKSNYVCVCGSEAFNVFNNGPWDTSIRCTKCGAASTAHSG